MVQDYLRVLGLQTELTKSKVVVIGDPSITTVDIGDTTLTVDKEVRFLGVTISHTGNILPGTTSYSKQLHTLWNKIQGFGFGASPIPFVKAIKIYLQPAIFYGADIWGLPHLREVMLKHKSPFLHERTREMLEFLKIRYGLPKDGFNMPIL